MKSDSFTDGHFKTIHSFRGGVRRELSFEDDWIFNYDTPYWVRVIEDQLCLDVYVFLRKGKKIIFSGQDALIDGRRELPYFYRTKWATGLPCSFVTFNDPSLYVSSNFGAGYLCSPHSWYMVKRAVDKIITMQGYSEEDVFFYGASAGGYWALSMAGSYPKSVFVVDIPQVNLDTYFNGARKEDFRATFNLTTDFPCVFDYWPPGFVLPKHLIYLQNSRDIFHIRTQYAWFLKRISQMSECNTGLVGNMSFLFYDTPPDTRSHSPLPQDKTIRLLTQLIEGNNWDKGGQAAIVL